MILVAGVIVSVLSAVMVMFVGKDRIEPVPHKHGNGFRMSDYFERGALKMSLIMFLFFMSYSGVLTFIAPYGAEKGLEWYASVFFVVMSVSTLICRMFLGKMYDRKGINRALVPFLLAYIAGMVMLGTVSSGPIMLVSAFMIGTMVAMLNMVSQAAVVHDVDSSRYGVAVSTLNTFMDLSYMVGPVINGVMIGYAGYSGNYLAMAVIAMFSFVLYLVLVGIPYHRSHGTHIGKDVPYGKH
jgi:MFS family permease